MKTILDDEEIQIPETLLEHVDVGKGDQRIGADDPESANLSRYGSFDDVRIGKAASCGDAIDWQTPQPPELLSILFRFKLAIARKRRGEARFSRAHGVALSGDGKG